MYRGGANAGKFRAEYKQNYFAEIFLLNPSHERRKMEFETVKVGKMCHVRVHMLLLKEKNRVPSTIFDLRSCPTLRCNSTTEKIEI